MHMQTQGTGTFPKCGTKIELGEQQMKEYLFSFLVVQIGNIQDITYSKKLPGITYMVDIN